MDKLKINFTQKEAENLIECEKRENDILRLVNPITQQIYCNDYYKKSGSICSKFWGRCKRCENCTSLRALQSKGRAYKIEILNNKTYLVTSRYLKIEGKPYVMEIINDVTNNLLMDSNQKDEIGKLIHSYNNLLITDSLTGVYNRRFLDEKFLPSLKCCHDKKIIIGVCVMDFDDFKLVNDTYGHQAGDKLLKEAACFWKKNFNSRKKDEERLVIRFGGDEMLIIVCGMSLHNFKIEIEECYRKMHKICYYNNDIQIPFNISFGIASSEEFGNDWTWDKLFLYADRRLYEAKAKKNL